MNETHKDKTAGHNVPKKPEEYKKKGFEVPKKPSPQPKKKK